MVMVITLPDGYNGHTALFDPDPIDMEHGQVKLRCVEPGKEYLTRWCYVQEWRDACYKAGLV